MDCRAESVDLLGRAWFEALHRHIKQIQARAPNASYAYLSTEARMSLVEKYMDSPDKVADMSTKHMDLESHEGLSEAVAHLVGGANCMPARKMGQAELQKLLYHAIFKFSRGQTTQKVLPFSDAEKLRKNKPLGRLGPCLYLVSELHHCTAPGHSRHQTRSLSTAHTLLTKTNT